MCYGLLFASSYFSVITPQGGSQNIIFAASGYLTQRELYKLGFIITVAFLAIYLLVGSPWVYFVTR
jgi:di/tricarboxylate transporter